MNALRSGDRAAAANQRLQELLVRLLNPKSRYDPDRRRGQFKKWLSVIFRERVMLMTQGAPIFNDTIRANLALPSPVAMDDDCLDRVGSPSIATRQCRSRSAARAQAPW